MSTRRAAVTVRPKALLAGALLVKASMGPPLTDEVTSARTTIHPEPSGARLSH